MAGYDETKFFKPIRRDDNEVSLMLREVISAMREKGHDPVVQLAGYLLSGDPTYITGHRNARNLIRSFERDKILEDLIASYVAHHDV